MVYRMGIETVQYCSRNADRGGPAVSTPPPLRRKVTGKWSSLTSLLPRDFFPAFDYFVGPATHAVARAHCQQLGGDLASIHSQAESDP